MATHKLIMGDYNYPYINCRGDLNQQIIKQCSKIPWSYCYSTTYGFISVPTFSTMNVSAWTVIKPAWFDFHDGFSPFAKSIMLPSSSNCTTEQVDQHYVQNISSIWYRRQWQAMHKLPTMDWDLLLEGSSLACMWNIIKRKLWQASLAAKLNRNIIQPEVTNLNLCGWTVKV